MTLSITDYDKQEWGAMQTASYPALRAFAPTYFHFNGVPTRAESDMALERYVDMMGEVNAFKGWKRALFSDKEIADIFWLRDKVHDLSGVWPISNLLSPWPVLRAIRHLNPTTVFEMSAGCGYLGAYLIKDGIDYTGSDVTQGLYIWQDRLWNAIGDHKHMPWWDFAEYHNEPFQADVVVCDSALAEMNWFAYSYCIRAFARMLGDDGVLMFHSVGDNSLNPNRQVVEDLINLGLGYYFVGDVNLFSRRKLKPAFRDMPTPSGKSLNDFFPVPMDLPENYAFIRFAGLC